jgi:hypothetical protein
MNEYQWGDLSLGMRQGFSAVFTEEMVEQFAALPCLGVHYRL